MSNKKRPIADHRERSLRVLRQFRIIYGSVRQQFRQIEKACGVSGSQLWILREVNDKPGIGVSDLAARLSIHQSTGSQLVEKLVKRKLLKKSRLSKDQRRVGLLITNTGKKVIDCAPGPAQGLLPEALTSLSDASLKSLERYLSKVIQELDVKDSRAADRPLSDL